MVNTKCVGSCSYLHLTYWFSTSTLNMYRCRLQQVPCATTLHQMTMSRVHATPSGFYYADPPRCEWAPCDNTWLLTPAQTDPWREAGRSVTVSHTKGLLVPGRSSWCQLIVCQRTRQCFSSVVERWSFCPIKDNQTIDWVALTLTIIDATFSPNPDFIPCPFKASTLWWRSSVTYAAITSRHRQSRLLYMHFSIIVYFHF